MALNIEVNENYRITSDSANVIVQRKHIVDPTKSPGWAKMAANGADPTPRAEWRDHSYSRTVPQALKIIGESQVRDSDAESLEELVQEIKRFNGEIETLLSAEGIRMGNR